MAGPFKMKGSPMQRNFGIGGSPMQNKTEGTSTIDKIKAASKAVFSNLGKVNTSDNTFSDKVRRSYKKNKKKYRDAVVKNDK